MVTIPNSPAVMLTSEHLTAVAADGGAGGLDPRPDLAEDHALWEALLLHARAGEGDDPESLYGALDGLRCLGARLAMVNGHARLFRGEIGDNEYQALRDRWLRPHHERLVWLLGKLDQWFGGDAHAACQPALFGLPARVDAASGRL